MKRHRTLVLCSGLALLVLVAIALQGAPVFGGIVWVPDWARQQPQPGRITQSASTETAIPKAPAEISRVDLSWVALLVAVVVLGVIAILIWRAVRKRLRRVNASGEALAVDVLGEVEPDVPQQPDAPQVRKGLDRALDILGEDREPRDAIEQAWLGLQDAAEQSGVRRLPAETPSEFTARILSRVGADRAAARTLLELYLRVRFGDAPVTAEDVAVAASSLDALRASWTSSTATSGGTAR
jgi:hypothetical protein